MILLDKINEAADFIKENRDTRAKTAVILGTGLSDFADGLHDSSFINYEDIPHFPSSTVVSHTGKLVFGTLEGVDLVVLQGRFHYYEGYAMQELTLPIRVLHKLGISNICITNIAGGLNETFLLGDLVLVTDHINLHPDNPLRGLNDDRYGSRFPVMLDAYDKDMISSAHATAVKHDFVLKEGVYVSLAGPSLETRAEYKYLKLIGGDLVGMSTVPEVIVARQLDMRVCVISCVSNIASDPETIEHADVGELIQVAKDAGPRLKSLIGGIVSTTTHKSQ